MKQVKVLLVAAFLCSSCGLLNKNNKIMLTEVTGEILVSNTQDFTQLEVLSNRNIAWGIGKTKLENGQPRDPVEANQMYGKYNAVFIGPASRTIYLTFDNGYENGNTVAILDTLKEKGVPAIFFLTGDYVKQNKELIDRMIAEGHIIGNHGYRHKSFPSLTTTQLNDELMKFNDLMKQNHNYEVTLVRPPKGEFSERSLAQSKLLGFQTLLWSFAYLDFDVNNQPNPKRSLERSLMGLHPGAIYLLHSLSDTNVEILPDLIDEIRKQGYRFIQYQDLPIGSCNRLDQTNVQCR